MKVTWEPFAAVLPGHEGCSRRFREATTNDIVVVNSGDVTAALRPAGVRIASARIAGPTKSHGTMAPNCAVADVKADGALVMCSAGDLSDARQRGAAARVARREDPGAVLRGLEHLRQQLLPRRGEAAAIMSQELGKPVRLQFSRQDEFGWDNYGPAHLADVRGAVDANGKLVAFEYQAWGHDGMALVRRRSFWRSARPRAAPRGRRQPEAAVVVSVAREPLRHRRQLRRRLYQIRISQNDMYDIPNRRLIEHRVVGRGFLKLGPLRAPLDPSYFFAQEGMMDELGVCGEARSVRSSANGTSRIARWLGVLKAAADAAKWTPRVAASKVSIGRVVTGRGIGRRHAPPAAEPGRSHHLRRGRRGHRGQQGQRRRHRQTRVRRDGLRAGRSIPASSRARSSACRCTATSLALKEEVQFNQTNVTSLDWNSYQTLRFGEHPAVTPIVVQQLNEKSTGAGEEVLPAVVAAIGNAFFDATGVRLRQFPLTPRRVLAALKSAGA